MSLRCYLLFFTAVVVAQSSWRTSSQISLSLMKVDPDLIATSVLAGVYLNAKIVTAGGRNARREGCTRSCANREFNTCQRKPYHQRLFRAQRGFALVLTDLMDARMLEEADNPVGGKGRAELALLTIIPRHIHSSTPMSDSALQDHSQVTFHPGNPQA